MNTRRTRPTSLGSWVIGVTGTAATAAVAAMVAATIANAGAVPAEPVDGGSTPDGGHRITTACHITPETWNASLDGPMWQCYRYLP
jgi:hypothetical protein